MAFAKAIIDLQAPENAGKFLTDWETVSFLRMTSLREVSYYHHVIILMFVRISSISTENLPQGEASCVFKTDVAENLPQGMTPFLFMLM